jgi:hypothetical protein
MSISAISGTYGVGPIQPIAATAPVANSAQSPEQSQATTQAPQLIAGTIPPLSSSVLATLLGEQHTLYGSFR